MSFLLLACVLSRHPVDTVPAPAAAPVAKWAAWLATPGPVTVDSWVSATWEAQLGSLLDLSDPACKGLPDRKVDIVLPVHVMRHPEKGDFLVDSGVPASMREGPGPVKGLIRTALGSFAVVEPLGEGMAKRGIVPRALFLTHAHFDHVLGLPELPMDLPVYTGPGELRQSGAVAALMGGTARAVLDGRPAVHEWTTQAMLPLGPVMAIDVVGDGSIYAISSPGHTPGSMAYLARTPAGPVLFAGDTSHTLYGWEHGATPGNFTADHGGNLQSLLALKALADGVPGMKVWVGHEMDGQHTGVNSLPGR
ncbi:MAG: MBL fold metallo-hydrolase [Deltaproteobacteria bacterium]|nr:MBL fold metallo-hydrolase [Deltaproteobacteria bacterium]